VRRPDDERALPGRWVHLVNLLLGGWLLTSPASLGYTSVDLTRSDVLAGTVLILLAVLGLLNAGFRYVTAFVGLWLVLEPLLAWSPDPAAYVNDTLVGAMVLTLTLLLPAGVVRAGPERPPGWTYNPSSFAQRAPIFVLGGIGFLTARYLAAFQLGYVDAVWDPFFTGTDEVLRSGVARAWPVSDAGLGALACLAAVLVAFLGDRTRWRTMPWVVVLFALLIVPMGVFGVVLVALQPIAVGAWCTWCLVVSAAMLFLIPFSIDELAATVQHLRGWREHGRSLWWTFWLGSGGEPEAVEEPEVPAFEPRAALRGVGATLPLVASFLIGAGLVAAPDVLGVPDAPDPIAGGLVIAISVVAMAEVARPLRWLQLPIAAWLLASPFVTEAGHAGLAWTHVAAGALLVALTLPIGRLREHYGQLDAALSWPIRRPAT
jgi:uncharacterized membrane protein